MTYLTDETMTDDIDSVDLPENEASALEYYMEIGDSIMLSKPAMAYLCDEDNVSSFEALAEDLASDSEAILSRFQSVIDHDIQTYRLGDIIAHAPLQMQRAIDPRVLSSILVDPTTGFKNLPILLEPPVVLRTYEGRLRLTGGNHRIAAIITLLLSGSCKPVALLDAQIKCIQVSVNIQAVRELMSSYDEDTGETIEPDNKSVKKTVLEIEHCLWISSNGSRKMSKGELQEASLFQVGVNRNDADSILNASFPQKGDAKLLDAKKALDLLFRLQWNDFDERTELENKTAQYLERVVLVKGDEAPLSLNTLSEIMSSFYTNLSKVQIEIGTRKVKGETLPKYHKIWDKDLKDRDAFSAIVESLTLIRNGDHRTLMEEAIDDCLALVTEERFAGNVAVISSKIGARMAELYNQRFHPAFKLKTEDTTAKKTTGKAKPKSRLTL